MWPHGHPQSAINASRGAQGRLRHVRQQKEAVAPGEPDATASSRAIYYSSVAEPPAAAIFSLAEPLNA